MILTLFVLLAIQLTIHFLGYKLFVGFLSNFELVTLNLLVILGFAFLIFILSRKTLWGTLGSIFTPIIGSLVFFFYFIIAIGNMDRKEPYVTKDHINLVFYSDYSGGGLHHPEYEVVVYQEIFPFVYKKIGSLTEFHSIVQSSWFDYHDSPMQIEYLKDGFILSYMSSVTNEPVRIKILYQ